MTTFSIALDEVRFAWNRFLHRTAHPCYPDMIKLALTAAEESMKKKQAPLSIDGPFVAPRTTKVSPWAIAFIAALCGFIAGLAARGV